MEVTVANIVVDGGTLPLSGNLPIDAIVLVKLDLVQLLDCALKIQWRAEWY